MISNTRFKSLTVTTTGRILLPESKKRKSFTIYNDSDSVNLQIGNNINIYYNNDYIIVPPNSAIHFDIPEDNPREPIYGRAASGSLTIYTYEAYAK